MKKLKDVFFLGIKIFKEKSNIIKKIIGLGLIFFGIIVIGAAFYMRYYAEHKQKNMMMAFEKSLKKDTSLSVEAPKLQSATNTDVSVKTNDKAPSDKAPDEISGTIGIIRIPKIDLKVAVGEGVDMETLKYAVGHFPETAMAGEKGNFCVAGHRSYTYSEYFNRLDEVNKGDEIYVKTEKGEFKYVVYQIEVVEPSEYSVLDKTNDATMTLVTCTPIRVATHRLIIKARLQ